MTDFSSWYSSDSVKIDLKHQAHSIRSAPEYGVHILIRSLTGGEMSQMGDILGPKMSEIKRFWLDKGFKVHYESLNQDDIKNKLKWTMKEAIDWVFEADIHYILCHPHQGNVGKSDRWTVKEIYENVDRLANHLGFPMGSHLKCPIFRQDKYVYIEHLNGIVNDTIKVDLTDPAKEFSSEVVDNIIKFLETQKARGYKKFIIKKGFVTNSGCVRDLKTVDEILAAIKRAAAKERVGFGFIPYALLQPQMANSHEAKVVCWNGRAMYLSAVKRGRRGTMTPKEFNSDKQAPLFAFAEAAIQVLKMNCPAFISDGLVRVDIFVDDFGDFKVNEIETLEAGYLTNHSFPTEDERYVMKALPNYWKDMTVGLVTEAIAYNTSQGKYNNFLPSPPPAGIKKRKRKAF